MNSYRQRFKPKQRKIGVWSFLKAAPAMAVGIALFGAVDLQSVSGMVSSATGLSFNGGSNCKIKGNISINSGERIYHMPGQENYSATKISPQYGERWFCSEAEARTAGWRKAGR